MSFAIGLRFYKIIIHKNRNKKPINFDDLPGEKSVIEFIENFFTIRRTPTDEGLSQRTWYIEKQNSTSIRSVHGWVKYGTHGFESKLVDNATKKENYHRKSTDLEEIPLYVHFWIPSNSNHAFVAFQSFQGRSCVSFVMTALNKSFMKANREYRLSYSKIMPSDGHSFLASPVKSLTMVKSSIPPDKFEGYLNGIPREEVEYEVSIKAKRKGYLGLLSKYKEKTTNEREVFIHDGIEFDHIKAEVMIGKKRRTVGVFGTDSQAGVIDISDAVKRGADGHPLLDSINREVETLMSDLSGMVKT